jgi:hypothetical protein
VVALSWRDGPAAHGAWGGCRPRPDSVRHGTARPAAGALASPAPGTPRPRWPLRHPPHTQTIARGPAARGLPRLRRPSRGPWYASGCVGAPVDSHAPRRHGAPPRQLGHRCLRPRPAESRAAHASSAALRPASGQVSLRGEARGVADTPRLRVPAKWHRYAGLMSRARSGAPDTSPGDGDSRPCCLRQSRARPQGPTPDMLRLPRAFPHYHCGCQRARRHGGAARSLPSRPDAGARVGGRRAHLGCARRPAGGLGLSSARPHTPPRAPWSWGPEGARGSEWRRPRVLSAPARSTLS